MEKRPNLNGIFNKKKALQKTLKSIKKVVEHKTPCQIGLRAVFLRKKDRNLERLGQKYYREEVLGWRKIVA